MLEKVYGSAHQFFTKSVPSILKLCGEALEKKVTWHRIACTGSLLSVLVAGLPVPSICLWVEIVGNQPMARHCTGTVAPLTALWYSVPTPEQRESDLTERSLQTLAAIFFFVISGFVLCTR